MTSDELSRVKQVICAVGYFRGEPKVRRPTEAETPDFGGQATVVDGPENPPFEILGTGFLVRQRTVLTNKHVRLLLDGARHDGIPKHLFRVVFHQVLTDGRGVLFHYRRISHSAWIREMDIAVIAFIPDVNPYCDELSPATFGQTLAARVGTPVMVPGYAFGSNGLEDTAIVRQRREYRIGPVAHYGFVSAVSRRLSGGGVDRLALDVRTVTGMSGAPVCSTDTGRVVGIHYGGTDLLAAFAFPLDLPRVRAILANWDDRVKLLQPFLQ